jgi:hypothetical protein
VRRSVMGMARSEVKVGGPKAKVTNKSKVRVRAPSTGEG